MVTGAAAGGREDGMTLVELLLVAVLGLLVLTGALALLLSSASGEPRVSERAAVVQQARAMVEAVTREVRQGYGIEVAEPDELVLLSYVARTSCGGAPAEGSIECRIAYECSADACTRTESDPEGGGGGTAVEVARGLASASVFDYEPSADDPSFVQVSLELPLSESEDSITLEGGTALRNVALGA
jgi:Tfp pilus assembly protein PilW